MIEEIKTMVELSYGQRRIAAELGITRDKLRAIMKENGIKTNYKFTNDAGDIKKRVADLFDGRWEYVGGYTGSDDYFKLKCTKCGIEKEFNAICLRKKKTPICDCVIEEKKKSTERERLRVAEISKHKKYIRNSILRIKITYKPTSKFTCKECGIEFYSKRDKKFCTQSCMLKYNNSSKKLTKRKRILENGRVENITLSKLYKRDKGICYICGSKCNKKDYKIHDNGAFIAGDSYPSIEHIIPIAKGGTHTWGNVMLAHRLCNSLKGAQSDVVIVNDRAMFNL